MRSKRAELPAVAEGVDRLYGMNEVAEPRLPQRERYGGAFSASEAAWAFAREYRK